MQFEFTSAGRIVFGAGSIAQVGAAARDLGRRALLVYGRSRERAAPVVEDLAAHGLDPVEVSVGGEPTTDGIAGACSTARDAGCDIVVAVGGGSVIDTGKAVSALLTNPGDLFDFLEVIGKGLPLRAQSAPCIAAPTTAGTGAEVTRNAVLDVPAQGVKVSLRSPLMLPALAVVDPMLTLSMPPALTASTGLDAFTQLLEAYVSSRANPLTDALCREGLDRVSRSLRRAHSQGGDASARADMSLASLLGGLALANAGLGAVHGFAGPLGGMLHASHGAICAALLPHVVSVNIRALRERDPRADALRRYDDAARIVLRAPDARAEDGADWIRDLCRDLGIPSLADLGFRTGQEGEAVRKARQSSSMKGNPVALTPGELTVILANAVGGTDRRL